jgi:hypothetical protein
MLLMPQTGWDHLPWWRNVRCRALPTRGLIIVIDVEDPIIGLVDFRLPTLTKRESKMTSGFLGWDEKMPAVIEPN